jgi:hypothetical protein
MTQTKPHVLVGEAFALAANKGAPKRTRRAATKTFSIRLTDEERRFLEREAGKLPLGTYVRKRLIGGDLPSSRTRRAPKKLNRPSTDRKSIAQVLAMLGRSDIYKSLNALAKAALSGSLPVTPELLDDLQSACADVQAMRTALLSALQTGASGEHDSGR